MGLFDFIGDLFGGDNVDAQKEGMKNLQASLDRIRGLLKPYVDAGATATPRLTELVMQGAPTADNYEQSPDYQFLLEEGQRAINRRSAGTTGSSAHKRSLIEFSQNLASQDYDRARQRYFENLNPYFQLSQIGQNAANTQSGFDYGITSDIAGARQGLANARQNMSTGIFNTIGNVAGSVFGFKSGYPTVGKMPAWQDTFGTPGSRLLE